MADHVREGLGLVGLGLLFGFFGLIWVANLFGVADEHAKLIARSRFNRALIRREWTADEVRTHPAFKFGRYVTGGGFMAFGMVMLVFGIVELV